MAKRKAGLHRKISSIFDGVPIPKSDRPDSQQPPAMKKTTQQATSPPPELQKPPKPVKPDKPLRKPAKHTAKTKAKQHKRKKYKFSTPVPTKTEQNEKKKIVVVVMLIIVLGFMLIKTFLPEFTKKGKTISTAEEIVTKALQQKQAPSIVWKIPDVYPANLRDPMRTGQSRNPVTGEWIEDVVDFEKVKDIIGQPDTAETTGFYNDIVIQSILYSQSGRSVVIDNKILYEGDSINGATIIKINKNSVEFAIGEQKFTKKFRP